ncbi:MAG: response regulator [Halobacteriovoraceae bacterium]|nr:response regulator [Halobacteriovoraceae bacterium]
MKVSSNLKILILDDCLDTRNYIKLILSKKGFKRLVSAHNGREALEILDKAEKEFDPIKVILADWQMPEMDGFTFLTKVKEDNRFSKIPFIMITSDNDRDHVIEAIEHGVNDYVIKPVKGDVLIEKLSRVFGHG